MSTHDEDLTVEAYLAAFDEAAPADLVGTPIVLVANEFAAAKGFTMPCAAVSRTDLTFASCGQIDARAMGNSMNPFIGKVVGTRGSSSGVTTSA